MVKKVRMRWAFIDSKAIWKASDKRSKVERHAEILLLFFCLPCKAGAASGSVLIGSAA